MCTKSNWVCPVSLQQSGIWAVICTACSLQLNSANPAYSMQGTLESVNIGIIYSDIVFISHTNTIIVPQRTLGPDGKLCCLSFSFVYIIITVWTLLASICSAFKSNSFHSNSTSHMYHVFIHLLSFFNI